jgi:hypothetical protein
MENRHVSIPLVDRAPNERELQRVRLILSTFQDGTGQLALKNGLTLPGWRDFERAVALGFGGAAQESKFVFDVLLSASDRSDIHYGLSCKMRETLRETDRTGRVTIELSNSYSKFWKELAGRDIDQANFRQYPDRVGKTLIDLVTSWHEAESSVAGGHIDLSKSAYLVLSWDKSSGVYQLHQFSLRLPGDRVKWHFPPGEERLKGDDEFGRVFEWYGQSGGQLKYYPRVQEALWASERFRLELLPPQTTQGLLAKAAAYFPELWLQTDDHEDR